MSSDAFLKFLGISKKAGKLVEGYNKCEIDINNNKLYLVLLSNDCSKNTVKKFKNYSENSNVIILSGYSRQELGSALGRSELSIVGISDKKLSDNLIKIAKNNNNISFGGERFVKDKSI